MAVGHDQMAVLRASGTAVTAGLGDRTQALPTLTLRPFCQAERCGGPREACDANDQRPSAPASGGQRDEPAPRRSRDEARRRSRTAPSVPTWPGERLTACSPPWNGGTLERQPYPSQAKLQLKGPRPRPEPDWSEIRSELARRDHPMTPAVLWQEDKAERPDAYQHSQYCDLYRRFEPRLAVILCEIHASGKNEVRRFLRPDPR